MKRKNTTTQSIITVTPSGSEISTVNTYTAGGMTQRVIPHGKNPRWNGEFRHLGGSNLLILSWHSHMGGVGQESPFVVCGNFLKVLIV